jgi:hypothetical protein
MKVEKRIRVCRLDPAGGGTFPTIDNTGMGLHEAIGGYAETFPVPRLPAGLVAMCDEDGMRRQLAYNVYSPLLGQQIVGPVLIARSKAPEFVSLTDEDVDVLQRYFGQLAAVITVVPTEAKP